MFYPVPEPSWAASFCPWQPLYILEIAVDDSSGESEDGDGDNHSKNAKIGVDIADKELGGIY